LRKFTFLYFIYLGVITVMLFMPEKEASEQMDKVNLYFVDRQMMRLVSIDYYISEGTVQQEAESVLRELIRGRDRSDVVRRMLPSSPDAASVMVSGEVAYVDISMKYFDFYEKGRHQEELVVYQIVNSLSSVDGISRVKFLFDGKEKKSFLSDTDMREAFVPDYCV